MEIHSSEWRMMPLRIFILILAMYASSFAQTNIRKADFQNAAIPVKCGTQPDRVRLKDGKYKHAKTGEKGDYEWSVHITSLVYRDIDRDGTEEAIVLYLCHAGTSGAYFSGLVYGLRGNSIKVLDEIEGGDKGDGGILRVSIRNGFLVVERYKLPPASSSACCPAFIETSKYRLTNKGLLEVGARKVRKIDPS